MTPEKLKQLRDQIVSARTFAIGHCYERSPDYFGDDADLDALFAQAAACEVWKREAMAWRNLHRPADGRSMDECWSDAHLAKKVLDAARRASDALGGGGGG